MTGWSTVSVGATRPFYTWITASIICELTVLDVDTIVVQLTLQNRDAISVRSKLHLGWADTSGSILGWHQSSRTVTDTLVPDEDES